MKYKLINKTTGEEHLCDKVTIDGFDYYVIDKEPTLSDTLNSCYYIFNNILYKRKYSHHKGSKKVIATNNPNIDIPKVVDEVERLAHNHFAEERFNREQENPNGMKSPQSLIEHYNKAFTPIYKAGYNKSQETHPFSEEDMIEFADFVEKSKFDSEGFTQHHIPKELLQLWKEQKPKIVYYE